MIRIKKEGKLRKKNADEIVLDVMKNLASIGENDFCFASQKTIARQANISVRTVQRSQTRLEKTGEIKRVNIPGYITTVWEVVMQENLPEEDPFMEITNTLQTYDKMLPNWPIATIGNFMFPKCGLEIANLVVR